MNYADIKPKAENANGCRTINSESFCCTREANHEGPHAAHAWSDVPLRVWWGDDGPYLFVRDPADSELEPDAVGVAVEDGSQGGAA